MEEMDLLDMGSAVLDLGSSALDLVATLTGIAADLAYLLEVFGGI
ncbi:hypothetical protein [Nocardia donostiensis]|nr:hypothetical protein [Nocardia donostiensis]